MKKIIYLTLVIAVIFFSCNKKSETSNTTTNEKTSNEETSKDSVSENITGINPDFEFNFKINQNNFKITNSYFEIQNNLMILNAISDKSDKLFLVTNSINPGNYELDNRSFLTTEDKTYFGDSGNIRITSYKEEMLSGNFDLEAVNIDDSTDIKNITGNFNNISTIKKLSEGSKFIIKKEMKVDFSAGKVDYNECNIKIEIDRNQIVFHNLDKENATFSFNIDKKIQEGTTCIYTSTNPAIDKIYLDLLKKQITLFYKNKNTTTYYSEK